MKKKTIFEMAKEKGFNIANCDEIQKKWGKVQQSPGFSGAFTAEMFLSSVIEVRDAVNGGRKPDIKNTILNKLK